ncbi:uncharacterized protein LOC116343469 isoform X2 [Contarinia nasturtii]|uniref:uncharacterized protein LOC116343469 isoform X2 n=1 Tax=Contarinia nasturtii TaxID=265458 RepID=UPI0012D42799|nr:uncharacterized protein LOC116343469 isoform X2 [Contarinia nasturtii]
MKFIIFTLLFAGSSFTDGSRSDGLTSVLNDLPSLTYTAKSIRRVSDYMDKLAKKFENSEDASSLLSIILRNSEIISGGFQSLAKAADDLNAAIVAQTDENRALNLFNLNDINTGVREIGDAEHTISDGIEGAFQSEESGMV